MRQELRRYRSALLLILAFTLGLGAQLLQAQVSVSPSRSRFSATIAPSTNDGAALGTAALSWSDLFLASGAVINVGNGGVTLTFAADSATLAGGQLLLPAGSASLPSLASAAQETDGIWFPANGQIQFAIAGVGQLRVSTDALWLTSNFGTLYFGASQTSVVLGREADNVLEQGQDQASPPAQTYKGPDALAGTDTNAAGGDMIFAAGRGTGTGNPGNIYFRTAATNAPGTAAGPLTTRVQIASSGVTIIASHTRFNVASSTTGTNTPVFSGNAPIGQTAPYVWVAAIASDGTAVWIPAWR